MNKKSFNLSDVEQFYQERVKAVIDRVMYCNSSSPDVPTYWRVATIYYRDFKIEGYVLIDTNGELFEVSRDELKAAIRSKEVCVPNLTLSKNGKLMPSSGGTSIRRGCKFRL